jgi:hypothetical protein
MSGKRPARTLLMSSLDLPAGGAASLELVPAPTPRQEADHTLNQLRAALAMHGITFPVDRALDLTAHRPTGPSAWGAITSGPDCFT